MKQGLVLSSRDRPSSGDRLFWGELLVAEGRVELAVSLFAQLVGDWLVTNVNHARASEALAELEGSLTPEEFAAAVERGRGMSLEDVRDELAALFSGSGSMGGSG